VGLSGSSSEAIDLLRELIACRSPSGHEAEVQAYIATWLDANGVSVELRQTPEGLSNVLARVESQAAGNGEGPHLLLLGHADTVDPVDGWTRDPYEAQLEGTRLYGLGAMDMKGGLVSAMLAMRELAQRTDWHGKVTFASVADEEASSRGALAFLAEKQHFDAAVVCEPHFHDPVIGAVGKVNLRITCTGVSAHGSRPEQGINAIDQLARLLDALASVPASEHPLVGQGSRCTLSIEGGLGPYQIRVPDHATCLINWHLIPGETAADVVKRVQHLASGLGSPASFTVTPEAPVYPSYSVPAEDAFLRVFSDIFRQELQAEPEFSFGRGVSDANYVADLGVPTVMFGPAGQNLHAADEWVHTEQIIPAARSYVALATSGRIPVRKDLQ
jgi:acetylornithine deacetylase/succinyl-diaminopimelate desuccinylase-like protein